MGAMMLEGWRGRMRRMMRLFFHQGNVLGVTGRFRPCKGGHEQMRIRDTTPKRQRWIWTWGSWMGSILMGLWGWRRRRRKRRLDPRGRNDIVAPLHLRRVIRGLMGMVAMHLKTTRGEERENKLCIRSS
ncbi:hypothetical protein EMPG_13958 [Blastomyces silverae]|uniref:Uncharacterized protein n=1 Tax=Blastomyces silverae TaxID=2060906 RepID=A0A0H1BGN3_9EURO|nr:hypothetical protein EMPG_13958 [Blastomyces silverae]